MTEVIYTAYRGDEQALKILGTLMFFTGIAPFQTGECVQDVMLREERVRDKKAMLALLFSCKGYYPSRYFRIVKPKDFAQGRFETPEWVPDLAAVPHENLVRIAVCPRVLSEDEITEGPLDIAIRNLHYDVRGLPRPAGSKVLKPHRVKSRSEWTSGHHAKVRERLAARFGTDG